MTLGLRVGAQIVLESTMFVRERISMFWTFAFPVVLILVLGYGLTGMTNSNDATITYLVSGIIGANLIAMAFFNIGASLLAYKDLGMLRRLRANNGEVQPVLTGVVVHRVVVVFGQSILMTLCAHAIFGFNLPAIAWPFWLSLGLCVVAFTALGLALAMLVPTTTAANVLANVIYLPLAFLSGAYFPVERLPFVGLIHALPSYGAIVLLRTSLTTPQDVFASPALAVVGAWTAGFLIVTFVLHRRLA